MFKNPGRKLKGLAKVIFVLSLLVYIFLGVGVIRGAPVINDAPLTGTPAIITGVVIIVVGFLVAWLSSIFTYAAGSAVDDLQTIKNIQLEQRRNG